jgi:hypothetical protein
MELLGTIGAWNVEDEGIDQESLKRKRRNEDSLRAN